MKKLLKNVIVLIYILAAVCIFAVSTSAADDGQWITAWSTRITELALDRYENIKVTVGDITARTVITPTASGKSVRIKFSNLYGKKDLTIKAATLARSTGVSSVDKSSFATLTFSGKTSVTIPAGKEIYCDSVKFSVAAGEDIAVSIYIKDFSDIKSAGLSGATTYISTARGNKTKEEDLHILSNGDMEAGLKNALDDLFGYIIDDGFLEVDLSYSFIKVVPIISDVEVLNPNDKAYSVVVIGDSTVANEFPRYLAEEIHDKGITDIGIAAKGVFGNQLLHDGVGYGSLIFGKSLISRMRRDIIGEDGLNFTNVKYVIVKIGANDIIHPVCKEILENKEYSDFRQPTAQDLIDGYKEFFDFCHQNGIKVIAASITQWKNTERDYFGTGVQYDRTEKEFKADWKIAQTVNKWLSTTAVSEGYCDGYIDYVDISKNPADPDAFLSEYTSDGIHPTEKLQKIWAEKFPLKLLGVTRRTDGISLSKSSATLYKGKTVRLKATVTPSNAADKSVIWKSSNPKIATVNSSGKVTAKGAGTCTITAETADRGYSSVGYTAKCKINVKIRPESIDIKGTKQLYTTQSVKFEATVLPADTTNKKVIWTSSDEKVATVSSKGTVKAVGKGTAVITVSSVEFPDVKESFTVKVKKKVSVQSVNLNASSKKISKGKTLKLKAEVYPTGASFPELKWTSSDSKVARVDSKGNVKALKAGKAVITCTSVDNPMCKAICVITVEIKATGVEISKTNLSMYASEKKKLKATVLPSDATDKKVKWKSSNKKVATVSSDGVVTAKNAGKCTITAVTESGGYVASCSIKVSKYVALKKISFKDSSVSVKDGKTYQLEVKFTPSKASDKSLVWSSSDKKIATVSSKGVVKGINPGTCTITAKSKETGQKITCKVKVKKVSVKSIKFKEEVYKVSCNESITLKPVISPSNATNQKVTWKSSNTDYATVSSKGKVKGLKAGKTVTITATTKDGKYVAKCKVKILKVPVEGVKLNKTKATTSVGGSVTLTPIFTPSDATNKSVAWVSSDTAVATVSKNGVVTPVGDGICKISCVTKEGAFNAYCIVTVKTVKATGITLDQSDIYADKGGKFTLKATVLPADVTNKRVTWSSSKTSVCTVNSDGTVTAVGAGTCYIKASTANGSLVATCKVTVV